MKRLDNLNSQMNPASLQLVDITVNTVGVFVICCLLYKGVFSLIDPRYDTTFKGSGHKVHTQD